MLESASVSGRPWRSFGGGSTQDLAQAVGTLWDSWAANQRAAVRTFLLPAQKHQARCSRSVRWMPRSRRGWYKGRSAVSRTAASTPQATPPTISAG